jgi:hypothetical protein
VVAAKPPQNISKPPPIIFIRTESGGILPAIKWNRHESYSWAQRLENRTFGKLKGAALGEAYRIVRDNGGLDISGEYSSIEIDDNDFQVGLKLQKEIVRKYESETCETDLENKQRFKRLFR